MQTSWSGGERFYGELTSEDLNLLDQQLNLFDKAREEINKKAPNREVLIEISRQILDIANKREEINPNYVIKEHMMETVEGTATFMGILASQSVGYDYGPMCFDNVKDVPFSDVVPFYRNKKLSEGFLRDRLPYETGA
ncbi:hypothetical protein [Streptococcus sp. X13SY08]|nr:hypothetical protein [Streptococcus sp. X13SY08]